MINNLCKEFNVDFSYFLEENLNYYVEILTGTMTDAVIRNISLQANARVTEDVVNEQAKKIEELTTKLESVQIGKNQEAESKITNLENAIKGHLNTINSFNNFLFTDRISFFITFKKSFRMIIFSVEFDTFI